MIKSDYDVLIIGAGPAGLTAGFLLAQHNRSSMILEASDTVGGISRTPQYKNFYFDIGGHRFFSKSEAIEKLWDEMLPDQLLTRPRSSRIFYQKKFYHYPLQALNALNQLGYIESIRCVLSYCKARFKPKKNNSFASWITNQFGERLYLHFFKTYTEKVWGMPCEDISADWAAQRIQGLSLFNAIKDALIPKKFKNKKNNILKTLTTTFRYPPRGPGMLWDACAEKYLKNGGKIEKNCHIIRCDYLPDNKLWAISFKNSSGKEEKIYAKHLVSSAPIKQLICDYLNPRPSLASIKAAAALKYRDFLIVVLILKDKNLFKDNWIYIHDRAVSVGRIQNFKSWSPDMVPDPNLCSYGMEYFCNEHDDLWNMKDTDLIQKAIVEIVLIGLATKEDILDGCVVRQQKAYPVYDQFYKENLAMIEEAIHQNYPNLHLIGRNGLHKYNNQDHSMMTAMLTVENIIADKHIYNISTINQDDDYHEVMSRKNTFDIKLGLRETPEKT